MKRLWKAGVLLGAAALTIALCGTATTETAEPEPTPKPIELVYMETPTPEPTLEPVPDENEDERIEDALVKQGYFRDDVPLSYEEQDFLHTACSEFGVDYALMLALIEHETKFQNVTGDNGRSEGYCQIQKKWWSGLMEEIGVDDLMKPYDNFRTACAILSRLTERYGSVRDALSAYNSGSPGATKYAASILEAAERWA